MSKKIFPFERLPPELRNVIYENIFGTGDGQVLKARIQVTKGKSTATKKVPFLPKNGAAILRLNKVTYKEAFPLLYASHTFTFATTRTLEQFATEAQDYIRYTVKWLKAATRLQSFEMVLNLGRGWTAVAAASRIQMEIGEYLRMRPTVEGRRQLFDMLSIDFMMWEIDPARLRTEEELAEAVRKGRECKEALEGLLIRARKLKARE
ncbi:hypothetical protein LTR85_006653 [Meristemomyces frigidus]|nr:hypothetical protein LTR85_006653 [Meristemomyces frigidus]